MDKETLIVGLYKSLVKSIEYVAAVWLPHAIGQIEEIEKGQQTCFGNIKDYYYSDLLKYLNLPSAHLRFRRSRGHDRNA